MDDLDRIEYFAASLAAVVRRCRAAEAENRRLRDQVDAYRRDEMDQLRSARAEVGMTLKALIERCNA